MSGSALAKQKHHNNGKGLLGQKIKQNGHHALGKAGKIDVACDVSGGKVVGLTAKHPTKGNLNVGKVKSMQKFAALGPEEMPGLPGQATVQLAQAVTTVWYYAYWFTDDNGDDWYYWFPVDYIIDDGSWVIYSA